MCIGILTSFKGTVKQNQKLSFVLTSEHYELIKRLVYMSNIIRIANLYVEVVFVTEDSLFL